MPYFEHEPFKEIYIYVCVCSSWVECGISNCFKKKLAYSQIIIIIKIKVHTKYMHGVGD
jgi:hypothetical protein